MDFTAQQIADFLSGEIIGNPNKTVSKVSKIEEGESDSLSFLANPKYSKFLNESKAGIILVSKSFEISKDNLLDRTLIVVDDAHASFTNLLNFVQQNIPEKTGISKKASINENSTISENGVFIDAFVSVEKGAKIGDNVKIYGSCYIGEGVEIAEGTILYAGVKLYANTKIGANCIIHSNTTIGSDGFGFNPRKDGSFDKVPHLGNVIVEDSVEIGANCTIDRGTVGSTKIKKGAKLDNQIQIAHNVEIGENTVIASQSGIAGSTKVGRNVMIGGQVGITGHLKIGNFVQIQAQSGVNHDVKDGMQLYGSPAMPANDYRKSYVIFKKLPEIYKIISKLEKTLKSEK